MALEHPADSNGNGARFLRDDHDHRVGNLAHADGSAMPRAEVAADVAVLRQRQDASRRRDSFVSNDHRTVVQRCLCEEDIAQQLGGDLRINHRAGLLILHQRGIPLEHNQHARALFGHCLTGGNRLGDHAVDFPLLLLHRDHLTQGLASDFFQHTPQLRLEHNDQRDQTDFQDLVEQVIHQIHIEQLGHDRQRQDDHDTLSDTRCARGLDHCDDAVDNKRNHQNINDVHDFNCGQHGCEILEKFEYSIHKQNSAYTLFQ